MIVDTKDAQQTQGNKKGDGLLFFSRSYLLITLVHAVHHVCVFSGAVSQALLFLLVHLSGVEVLHAFSKAHLDDLVSRSIP